MNTLVFPYQSQRAQINLPQNAAWQERIVRFVDDTGAVFDITPWTFTMDIRREHGTEVLISCSENNGRLVRNNTLGSLTLSLSQQDVEALGVGRYRYDLRVVRPAPAPVWYPIAGILSTSPQITR